MSTHMRCALAITVFALGCGTPSTIYVRDGGGDAPRVEAGTDGPTLDNAPADLGADSAGDGSADGSVDVGADVARDQAPSPDVADGAMDAGRDVATDAGLDAQTMDAVVADVLAMDAPADVSMVDAPSVDAVDARVADVDAATCPSGQLSCAGMCVDSRCDTAHCGACGRACGTTETCLSGTCTAEVPRLLSLRQPATQSSISMPPSTPPEACCGPQNGNDGVLTNLAHTENEAMPWWQVDLGSVFQITRVEVYNRFGRPGGCPAHGDCARVSNFDVRLSVDAATWSDTHFGGIALYPTTIVATGLARYVRIQSRMTTVFDPAEISVFGINACTCGTTFCGASCVSTQRDAANCGTCGNRCGGANAVPACASGRCTIASCNAGFGNCDGMAANGCETNTLTSAAHCGGCGMACSSGSSCISGRCAATSAVNIVILGHGAGTNPKLYARSTTDASPTSWAVGPVGPATDTSTFVGHLRALNGRYWIGTSARQLFNSTDGVTWNLITTLPHAYSDIGFDALLGYFIVSNTTAVSTSADGTTWVQHVAPIPGEVVGVTGGQWTITARGRATVARSADGVSWAQRTIPTSGLSEDSVSFLRCASSPYLYLFRCQTHTGPSSIIRSVDGVIWSSVMQTTPFFNTSEPVETRCLNDVFSHIGLDMPYAPSQNFSVDGVNWTHFQIYSGYDTSRPFVASRQTWDSSAGLYIAVQQGSGSEWSMGSKNSYFRAAAVGGAWTLQTISSLPFSGPNRGAYDVASLNER